jgi:hypothetical protein
MRASGATLEDALHRTLIHHWAHVLVLRGITDGQLRYAVLQLLNEGIVNLLVYDGARTRRALLAGKTECRGDHAVSSGIEISRIGVHHDGILATHLEHGPLDPDLPFARLRGAGVNVEADFFRTGEGDEARFRMLDDRVAECRAGSRTEVHHACRQSNFFQRFKEFCCDGR